MTRAVTSLCVFGTHLGGLLCFLPDFIISSIHCAYWRCAAVAMETLAFALFLVLTARRDPLEMYENPFRSTSFSSSPFMSVPVSCSSRFLTNAGGAEDTALIASVTEFCSPL